MTQEHSPFSPPPTSPPTDSPHHGDAHEAGDPQQGGPASPEAIALGYEPERLGARWYLNFIFAMAGGTLIVLIMLWVVMRALESATVTSQSVRNSAVTPTRPAIPPGPQLQPSPTQGPQPRQPWQDMADYRQREIDRLNSYGIDRTTGRAQIPIERAMELLASKGLPTTQPALRLPLPATRQYNPESSGGR